MKETKIEWQVKTAATRLGISLDEYLSRIALGLKWCTACKEWHSRYVFPVDKSRGDGLSASCKPRKLKRRLTPEEKLERNRRTYRSYYAGQGGPAIRERIYARKRNCEPIYPRHRELVLEKFEGICAYCGDPATTIDHVIPVSLGGRSHRGNILPACGSCNSSKGTKPLDGFLSECYASGFLVSELIAEELCMEYVL